MAYAPAIIKLTTFSAYVSGPLDLPPTTDRLLCQCRWVPCLANANEQYALPATMDSLHHHHAWTACLTIIHALHGKPVYPSTLLGNLPRSSPVETTWTAWNF